MTAGVPGLGLGGLLYMLLGGWMLLREGGRILLGRGGGARLRTALKHAALAGGMVLALWASLQALRFVVRHLVADTPLPNSCLPRGWAAGLPLTLGCGLCLLGGLLLTLHLLRRALPLPDRE